jgi:hypothetical protein
MTDYYPLLTRAVLGLDPSAPGESRRALYERARAALVTQLRSMQPSISESEITRERLSLEEAVRKVESEAAARSRERYPDFTVPPHRDRVRRPEPASAELDPLAELARLIGQTDPFANFNRTPQPEPADGSTPGVPPWMKRADKQEPDPTDQALEAIASILDKPESPSSPDASVATEDSPEKPAIEPFGPVELRSDEAQIDQLGSKEEEEEEEEKEEEEEEEKDRNQFRTAAKLELKLSLPPISELPEQNERKAIAFRPSRRGPLELLPDAAGDFLDPEQSQLYGRMRAQLVKLQEDIPSQERIQIDDAVNDFLDQPVSWQAVEFKKVLWLCGNALRNKLAQHDAVRNSLDPHYSTLPAGVAVALRKPVETWNVFVLGDSDLVELDAKRLGPQEQQIAVENINAARPIVENAATDRQITTEQTGNVLTASLQAASSPIDNINTKQAQDLAEGTSRNLVIQIVRRGYLFCQNLVDPQTDEARALVVEYKKGIAKAAGVASFGAAAATISYGASYAASFFEFVALNAEVFKAYITIALQNDQLSQVIDVIEYTKTSLNENPAEKAPERPVDE